MQEVFHKLLRPELVYKYIQPLSSDAFRYSFLRTTRYDKLLTLDRLVDSTGHHKGK